MAGRPWVATSKRHAGIAVVDLSTVAHFGIGTAAGLSGIDPKMALLVALMAEGAFEIIKHRDAEVIFERGTGQSKINEIVDLLSMVMGAYVGQGVRAMIQHGAHADVPAPAPPPTPPVPPVVAGLNNFAW